MNTRSIASRPWLALLGFLLFVGGPTISRGQLPDEPAELATPKSVPKEDIDLSDEEVEVAPGTPLAKQIKMRVRLMSAAPESKKLVIGWRVGGEGQGGASRGGWFKPDTTPEPSIDKMLSDTPMGDGTLGVGQWSEWTPIENVMLGGVDGWRFVRVWAQPVAARKGQTPTPYSTLVMEFEFSRRGKTVKSFKEKAPDGPTVGFAFPGRFLRSESTFPTFVAEVQGLSTYAHTRLERLQQAFKPDDPLPQKFAIIGHLGGYGKGHGYGIRHCNPAIVADECRTEHLLGINGLIGSVAKMADIPEAQTFKRIVWTGSGTASIASVSTDEAAGCPYDPRLSEQTSSHSARVLASLPSHGAQEVWVQAGDEIGVAVKDHMYDCPRCQAEFREFVKQQGVTLATLGVGSWDEVLPIRLATKAVADPAAAPPTAAENLLTYYTIRFMTHATSQMYASGTQVFKQAQVPLFSMMAPTPSWGGSTLDWHEFYDDGANSAVVWETSNRDARVWQWESYLGDMARCIAERHDAPIGCLIKPHRGAPLQRMLSVVSRGVKTFEWYTYGPDYAKGDSFSQSPELLKQVATAARFLARAEPYVYDAHWLGKPQVALVMPRSGQLWANSAGIGNATFEDAKWVYLALTHAHIPVDILSEQQLAEGALDQYKVAYVLGPNLRRDAATKLEAWIRAGGTLWTDAMGLARDEANQPAPFSSDVLGLGTRTYEGWGDVRRYGAVGLPPVTETEVPAAATFEWSLEQPRLQGQFTASVGREPLEAYGSEVLATFADGKPAMIRRTVGQGSVIVAGFWGGVSYSAKVRQAHYDMLKDYDDSLRALITLPALERGVYRPVVPASTQVEAVALEHEGQRSIALMNWNHRREADKGRGEFQVAEQLDIALPGVGPVTKALSLELGELTVTHEGDTPHIVLPKLAEIDLILID